MSIIHSLNEEDTRIVYAYLLALTSDDMQTVEEMEEARAEDDIERVKKISEWVIARAGDSTKTY